MMRQKRVLRSMPEKALPVWLYFLIALKVVVIVVVIAWLVERTTPVPSAIQSILMPFLGWTALTIFLWMLMRRMIKK